jgi:hypothetical protein
MELIRANENGERQIFNPYTQKPIPTEKDEVLLLEHNAFYITYSGYEYIKVNSQELWNFVSTCQALDLLDENSSFHSLNIFIGKQRIDTVELESFSYKGYSSSIYGLLDALFNEEYTFDNYMDIIKELKITRM